MIGRLLYVRTISPLNMPKHMHQMLLHDFPPVPRSWDNEISTTANPKNHNLNKIGMKKCANFLIQIGLAILRMGVAILLWNISFIGYLKESFYLQYALIITISRSRHLPSVTSYFQNASNTIQVALISRKVWQLLSIRLHFSKSNRQFKCVLRIGFYCHLSNLPKYQVEWHRLL